MSRVQIEIFLGTLLVLITSFVLLQQGFNEEARMARMLEGQQAQAIEVGASLFEINCAGCHGTRGEGIPGLCPPLNDQNFFNNRLSEVGWGGALEDYIVATVSSGRLTSTRPELYVGGGRPAMPAWSDHYGGPLREDQIRNIAAFILNWEATAQGSFVPVKPAGELSDDPVVRGESVYKENGCGGCHALGSLSAGAVGPALTQIGTVAETRVAGEAADAYIRSSIISPSAHVVEGYPDKVMPANFGEVLTAEQLDDLIAFLAAQK